MPKALTYDDAVRLRTGASPTAAALGTAVQRWPLEFVDLGMIASREVEVATGLR